MTRKVVRGLLALALTALATLPALAQSEVKEKPPMYSYVGVWNIPRPQWSEMEKDNAANQKVLEKALANGTIIAYGEDLNLIHQNDGWTHDQWWSSMSMAGLLNVLEQFYQSGSATSSVLSSATRHEDSIYVSRYYNWHSGSWKGAYTRVGIYKLKAEVSDEAIDKLAKNLVVPLLEQMLSDGVIHEYEIDVQAVHTEAPGTFTIEYIAASAEGLDKVNAALQATMKANPLDGPAFASMTDAGAHRDELARTTATYK
jgi:hypothetical protein